MQYREILDQLHTHVANLFHANKDERFIYHNLRHTEQVVENTVKIANHYQLSDHDFFCCCCCELVPRHGLFV
jgi:hypothetical protein